MPNERKPTWHAGRKFLPGDEVVICGKLYHCITPGPPSAYSEMALRRERQQRLAQWVVVLLARTPE